MIARTLVWHVSSSLRLLLVQGVFVQGLRFRNALHDDLRQCQDISGLAVFQYMCGCAAHHNVLVRHARVTYCLHTAVESTGSPGTCGSSCTGLDFMVPSELDATNSALWSLALCSLRHNVHWATGGHRRNIARTENHEKLACAALNAFACLHNLPTHAALQIASRTIGRIFCCLGLLSHGPGCCCSPPLSWTWPAASTVTGCCCACCCCCYCCCCLGLPSHGPGQLPAP